MSSLIPNGHSSRKRQFPSLFFIAFLLSSIYSLSSFTHPHSFSHVVMTTNNDTRMTVTTFRDLPHDVLLNIIEHLDSNNAQLVQVGLVSQFISHLCFQKLWHTPLCKSEHTLKLLLSTLLLDEFTTAYPYRDWFTGISLNIMQPLVFDSYKERQPLPFPIKTLQLVNVHASTETSQHLIHLLNNTQTLREIHLSNCCNELSTCLITAVNSNYSKLTRICIEDCHVPNRWVKQITHGHHIYVTLVLKDQVTFYPMQRL
ncbi:unnamed protein product [Mucor hiemalis]